MTKYLLNNEKKQINDLYNTIQTNLYQKTNIELKQIFYNLIQNNKDASIEDLLNEYINSFIYNMKPLLDSNLTLGLQFGIKNNYFQIDCYGGTYLSKNQYIPINEKTLFSFDSISKIITSIITMKEIRNNNFKLNTKINNINNNYQLDATIESILKFTSPIRTQKRIENLSPSETIKILKECKENLTLKKEYEKYYEYNDIGYMILRQIINNFPHKLDQLLQEISPNNLTYKTNNTKTNITGGKINEEYITQDQKGRGISFPGHTGLYGNISGLLDLYNKLMNTDTLLTKEEKEILLKQPYKDPVIKTKNTLKYTNKIAGLFKVPEGITSTYDKLSIFDIPNQTTKNATASAGTCGSWVMNDNLTTSNQFGKYTAGILTNPYSFVEAKKYENDINPSTNNQLQVNRKGTIIGYSKILNPYKETITNYAIILELITEYIKINEKEILTPEKKLIKKIY